MQHKMVYEKDNVQIFQINERVWFRYHAYKIDDISVGNGAYIKFGDKLLSVDAPNIEHAQLMQKEVQELFGQPIDTVLLTHFHHDHVEGLPVFTKAGVPVIAAQGTADWVVENMGHKNIMGVSQNTTIRDGDETIKLKVYPGTNHSLGDMFICLDDDSIIFTGDAVVPTTSFYITDANFENWFITMAKLAQLQYETIMPGHGPVATPEIYANGLAYFCDLREAVLFQMRKLKNEQLTIDTPEQNKKFAKEILTDKNNIHGQRLIGKAIEERTISHIVDVYRCISGKKTFA